MARGLDAIPLRGIVPATLTVPGAVDTWCEAHAALGRLPLARDLAAAIEHARDGFPATPRLAHWTGRAAPMLAGEPEAARIFLPGGVSAARRPAPAEPRPRAHARGHRGLGRDGFYAGEVAREAARFARAHGGFFTEEDFAAQRARWEPPLTGTYRGVTIHETPPPTQGFTVLQMLTLVEPFALGAMEHLGPDAVHLLVQAKQLAFHDRDHFLADPDFAHVPVDALLSARHLDARRRLIDPARALTWDAVPAAGSLAGDTVYVAAVDADGQRRLAHPERLQRLRVGRRRRPHRRRAPEPQRLLLPGPRPPEPARARQAPPPHPHRLPRRP